MADPYEHAILRVVPDVAREEFVNAGAIVVCTARGYLGAATALDERRLVALCRRVDLELVREHLNAVLRVCGGEGPMGALPVGERFRWLVAPRNAIVQTSAAHGGVCTDPEAALAHLLATVVR